MHFVRPIVPRSGSVHQPGDPKCHRKSFQGPGMRGCAKPTWTPFSSGISEAFLLFTRLGPHSVRVLSECGGQRVAGKADHLKPSPF